MESDGSCISHVKLLNSINRAWAITCWHSLQEVEEETLCALLETDFSQQGLVDV